METQELNLWGNNAGNARSPGEFIREELVARGWGQVELARITNRPIQTINEIIQGKRGIMPEMAVALGHAFKSPPELWLKREMEYRLSKVERTDPEVERRAHLFEVAPIKEMQKRNWITPTNSTAGIEEELCRFFGVPTLDDGIQISASMRQTNARSELSASQNAWAQRGAQLARMLNVRPFDQTVFETSGIERIRKLASETAGVGHVPRIMAELGIRFVIVEPLPKTYTDGAAFWLDGNPQSPVIMLSLRYDRIDWFWHTLAHELMHIKHGDSQSVDSNLVGQTRNETLDEIELRADAEGAELLVPTSRFESFVRRHGGGVTRKKISNFSKLVGIHPGVVNGQLQHRGVIPWSANRDLLVKIKDLITAAALTDGWGQSPPRSITIAK